jgi:hypothetical protein
LFFRRSRHQQRLQFSNFVALEQKYIKDSQNQTKSKIFQHSPKSLQVAMVIEPVEILRLNTCNGLEACNYYRYDSIYTVPNWTLDKQKSIFFEVNFQFTLAKERENV